MVLSGSVKHGHSFQSSPKKARSLLSRLAAVITFSFIPRFMSKEGCQLYYAIRMKLVITETVEQEM